MDKSHPSFSLPIGANMVKDDVFFRVFAPDCREVTLAIETDAKGEVLEKPLHYPLSRESSGYFSLLVPGLTSGMCYRYQLEDKGLYPDPASRFQPEGPFGPSQIIDPYAFTWTDNNWHGIASDQHILYEIHIGTFTKEGTWRAAANELPALKALGITTIEMMPVADFPGRFGWGYDGVNLFAPTHLYGTPDDLRYFVNAAHEHGLAVILDVVYNHLGQRGNYLKAFAADYFSHFYKTDWGEALNFDGENNAAVREFFISNSAYWIREFHFDGLRLDATQDIFDQSEPHILSEIIASARAAGEKRQIFIVAENEPQHTRMIRSREEHGFNADAAINDDFHHSAMVALTGRNEAYYTDYLGKPQEFISLARYGYLYQGQYYAWQKKPRGTYALDIPPHKLVNFLENHDQVANSGRGYRVHMQTSPGCFRALTAVLLLFPQIPLLFQGQEFGSSKPFFYFADHDESIARKVNEGRAAFLAQFPSLATEEMQHLLPDPADPKTFMHSILDREERYLHKKTYALHKDLLHLRKTNPIFTHPEGGLEGAVLGEEAFVIRYFGGDKEDCLLLVNLGRDLHLAAAPEPLLAPLPESKWVLTWSSEAAVYGGCGTAAPYAPPKNWSIPGHAALVLMSQNIGEDHHD